VDLEPLEHAGRGEPDDRPVVAGAATPPGLPAVGHAARWTRLDEVVARAEEHVAAALDDGAVLERGQVDRPTERGQSRPPRHDLAMDPQPRDAAVGKDREPDMREPRRAGDR